MSLEDSQISYERGAYINHIHHIVVGRTEGKVLMEHAGIGHASLTHEPALQRIARSPTKNRFCTGFAFEAC